MEILGLTLSLLQLVGLGVVALYLIVAVLGTLSIIATLGKDSRERWYNETPEAMRARLDTYAQRARADILGLWVWPARFLRWLLGVFFGSFARGLAVLFGSR